MRKLLAAGLLLSTALATSIAATAPAAADEGKAYDAVLAGHAVLPAKTLIPAPADAPESLKTSGKYTGKTPARIAGEPTDGDALPFNGQPVQGFSGIKTLGDGTYFVGTDNGFGKKVNSPDAMLMVHTIKPDFAKGTIEMVKTTFISDPDKVIPFVIVNEGTDTRYLTGADLDVEGFQPIGDKIYIGDEFGPYVIAVDAASGKVTDFFETEVNGKTVRSPDNYAVQLPNPDGARPDYNLKRSKGFEGFAQSMDGTKLYGLLEGPLFDDKEGAYENIGGVDASRIVEFDVAKGAWTGRSWLYPFAANGHAIGDFNMIDETRGLVIERDDGQGDAELACKDGASEGCFKEPATFKRIYMISFDGVEADQPVKKVGYIDLMDIKDPDGLARLGKREDGRFTFPFVTIENVDKVDDETIIVGNDNNFPFSKGRDVSALDNNEMVILKVGDFLKAH